jgi:hypothetical protein
LTMKEIQRISPTPSSPNFLYMKCTR